MLLIIFHKLKFKNLLTKKKTLYISIIMLFCISNYIINAQTIISCDSIKSKIIEIAKRHASTGAEMKTEMVLSTFAKNDSCFTKAQLIDLYENDFISNNKMDNSRFGKYFLG